MLQLDFLPTLAVILIAITSVGLLLTHDWRWSIILLALQYAGVAGLTSISWTLEMAMTKMISGWMAGAVLGMAMASVPGRWKDEGHSWPAGRLFRLLAALLVSLAVFTSIPKLSIILPSTPVIVLTGGLFLMGFGLLLLGLTAQPLPVAVGLLTFLGGFEIIYAPVESSILVAGLFAGVNIGIGLAGAYLLTASEMEQEFE